VPLDGGDMSAAYMCVSPGRGAARAAASSETWLSVNLGASLLQERAFPLLVVIVLLCVTGNLTARPEEHHPRQPAAHATWLHSLAS